MALFACKVGGAEGSTNKLNILQIKTTAGFSAYSWVNETLTQPSGTPTTIDGSVRAKVAGSGVGSYYVEVTILVEGDYYRNNVKTHYTANTVLNVQLDGTTFWWTH